MASWHILLKILKRIKILEHFNFTIPLHLNKKKFKIPIIQGVGESNLNISEPWMIEIFNIILPIDNRSFIDVGANVGQTLLKLRSLSSEINYIGFEPNPTCINYLNYLITENSLKSTYIIPFGISDKCQLGVLNFFHSSKVDSSASMVSQFRRPNKIIRKEFVPLINIEKVKEQIEIISISILKIDVEGGELEVMESFYHLIKQYQPIILIEILPCYNEENIFRINRQNKIQTILINLEYSMFRIIKSNNIFRGLIEIQNIGIHSDLNNCEYVMVPIHKKETFYNRYSQHKNFTP